MRGGYIYLPKDTDLKQFVKDAYALSKPQGLGILHFRDGPLSDEDAQSILDNEPGGRVAVAMDYVHGRAVKMAVWRDDDGLYIAKDWFDHTPSQLSALLNGKEEPAPYMPEEDAEAFVQAAVAVGIGMIDAMSDSSSSEPASDTAEIDPGDGDFGGGGSSEEF